MPQDLYLDRPVAPGRERVLLPAGVHPGLRLTVQQEACGVRPTRERAVDRPLDDRKEPLRELKVTGVSQVLVRLADEPPCPVGRVVVDIAGHREIGNAPEQQIALVRFLQRSERF